jgi:ribosome-associated protein
MLPATRAFYDLERLWALRPGDRPESAEDELSAMHDDE